MAPRVEQSYSAHTKSIDYLGKYTATEIPFIVFDAADEDDALKAVLNTVDQTLNGLSLSSVDIDSRENASTYKVNAVYKSLSVTSGDGGGDDSEAQVNFDCSGGTKHITYAISQKRVYGTGKDNAGGAIGWNGKGSPDAEIAGVDVPCAQMRETYTKIISASKLTTAYKKLIAGMYGKVNKGNFKGWAEGECMFLGMSFSAPAKGAKKIIVTFNFGIQLNETDCKVGEHGVSKKGYEYTWAITETVAGENAAPQAKINAIYVAQVCEYADFGVLGV